MEDKLMDKIFTAANCMRAFLILEILVVTVLVVRDFIRNGSGNLKEKGNFWNNAFIGCITNMFDTLGIGSFAPTQFWWKTIGGLTDVKLIPGTLNVGDAFPVVLEAVLFMTFVDLEPLTLVSMLVAAMLGGWIGAAIVCKMDRQKLRIGLVIAMLGCAVFMMMKQFGVGPYANSGEALGLHGVKLVVAVVINFFLGAGMTLGFGLYAPCLALVCALGMNVGAAFPIMMGSCAIQMCVSSVKFIKEGAYDKKATLLLAVFGCVGVAIAYFIIKSLPLTVLLYIICGVMVYTSVKYIMDYIKVKKTGQEIY